MGRRVRVALLLSVVFTGILAPVGQSNASTQPIPALVDFEDRHTSRPAGIYAYHGWHVYDVDGASLRGTYNPWTAVLTGPNGPQTFSGRLDYNGFGVLGYYAGSAGVDSITVTVGSAVGEATRVWGIDESKTPVAEPSVAVRIEFDDNHLSHPTPYYGYHGWQVYDEFNQPLRGAYHDWVAVVTGPNGPLTFTGKLDYYGRGVFGYEATQPGTDILGVTIGSATGDASRSYQGDLLPQAVPTPSPVGDVVDTLGEYRTPAGQILVVNTNLKQVYNDSETRRRRYTNRMFQLTHKSADDGMGYSPDIFVLNELDRPQADDIAADIANKIRAYVSVAVAAPRMAQAVVAENTERRIQAETAILFNRDSMQLVSGSVGYIDHSYTQLEACLDSQRASLGLPLDMDGDGREIVKSCGTEP